MKEVKILSCRIRDRYWKETVFLSIRDDAAMSVREMTELEKTLQPYFDEGYDIRTVVPDEDAELFVIFLEREK